MKEKTHYSEHSILIWKYKSNYLSSALVTRLINVSEKLIAFNNPHVLKMLIIIMMENLFILFMKAFQIM